MSENGHKAYDQGEIESAVVMYMHDRSSQSLDLVAEKAMGYVQGIVARVINPVPNLLSHEDLVQAGMIGLLSALKRYDPTKGAFRTWCYPRVLGAAQDSVRRMSPTSRTRNVQMVEYEDVELHLTSQLPSPEDILDEAVPDESSVILKEIIGELSYRQQSIILFQLNGIKLSRVAILLGVSDSQVSQDKRKAMRHIRSQMSERLPETVREVTMRRTLPY